MARWVNKGPCVCPQRLLCIQTSVAMGLPPGAPGTSSQWLCTMAEAGWHQCQKLICEFELLTCRKQSELENVRVMKFIVQRTCTALFHFLLSNQLSNATFFCSDYVTINCSYTLSAVTHLLAVL